ncbi:ABC transporter ATP-binding protein [Rubritalea sp.]|uniref:ABC transporter ATP-binding protein n=1 Tax=Rubritalea sp. TaxID=2109375 RepID=UPI003EF73AF0
MARQCAPMLELQDVKTHFPVNKGLIFSKLVDTVKAVNGVTLNIKEGEILGLVGESGCGKSTLSRTIMQLIPATGGTITLEGTELTSLPKKEVRARRLDFQMIFQDPYASLNPRMTVFTTLAEAITQRHPSLKKSKPKLTDSVVKLMERCGLNPSFMQKYPHEFSGGQRQRIAIARALAPEPKLIIADEPVSALDVSIQSQILNLLLDLRSELNLTMIFISHDLSVVRYIADNIAVMYKGEIVEYGKAEELFNSPKHPYTKRLLDAIPSLESPV